MSQANPASVAANTDPAKQDKLSVKIVGMDCGACAMTIESGIGKLAGVEDVSVSFTTETMNIDGKVALRPEWARGL
jgi:copper chaperone CopZ